jgi:hypothetical protein
MIGKQMLKSRFFELLQPLGRDDIKPLSADFDRLM